MVKLQLSLQKPFNKSEIFSPQTSHLCQIFLQTGSELHIKQPSRQKHPR